ncbi:GDSL esterase/lipase At5g55050-like [Curcuma longa]|uniref:GDSL esterase/lipase At5g55050-like n=1 Tax=Curcuma longa TaxID=136217 RepID=UPI003D9F84BE
MNKVVFFFLLCHHLLLRPETLSATTLPAIFVFGDSTIDVGNNNFLPDNAPKANFPPYGVDYPGQKSTGRFCNGFLGIDFIAKAMGLAASPPSFLSLSNAKQTPRRGVNFASAGSGILPTTGNGVIVMSAQIRYFEGVAAGLRLGTRTHKKGVSAPLSESLFFFSVGSNDLFAFAATLIPGNDTRVAEIVAPIIDKFKTQLQMLYHMGARKFAVAGTGLLGCIPAIRVLDPSYECNVNLNHLSMHFKNATEALLEELRISLRGFEYSFADAYEMGIQIDADLQEYGFTEPRAACCGSGRLNAEGRCTPNATYCRNRNQYLFWDMNHPTQALYKVIAQLWLFGPPEFAYPVNLQSLLQS